MKDYHVIQLDKKLHKGFLAKKYKDPIDKKKLKAGDKIVICAHCHTSYLEENWSEREAEHGDKTLQELPKEKESPVIIYFVADRRFINNGQSVKLNWRVRGITIGTEFRINNTRVKKNHFIDYPTEDTTYTLYVKRLFSPPVEQSLSIKVSKERPIIYFFKASRYLRNDDIPIVLTWKIENFEKIFIYADGIEYDVTQEEVLVVKPMKDTEYLLKAKSYYNKYVEQKITVKVNKNCPTVHFQVKDSKILNQFATELRWDVEGATTIFIDNDIGEVKSNGMKFIQPLMTTVYTLTATSYFGYETVSKVQVDVISFALPRAFLIEQPIVSLPSSIALFAAQPVVEIPIDEHQLSAAPELIEKII